MRPFLHRANFTVQIDELCDQDNTNTYSKLRIKVIELEPKDMSQHQSKRRKSDESMVAVENLDLIRTESSHFLLKMFKDPFLYGTNVTEETLQCREHYRKVEDDRMTQHGSRLPSTITMYTSLVYIVKGPECPGKFMAQKAKELGVPHGPLNGRLQKGETIVLDNGVEVRPEMCIGPSSPGPIFIYLDIPTEAHMDCLLAKLHCLQDYLAGGSLADRTVLAIFHSTRELFSDLSSKMIWSTATKTILIDESYQLALESPSFIQNVLSSKLGASIYPIPFELREETVKPLTKYHWINTGRAKQSFFDETDATLFLESKSSYKSVRNTLIGDDLLITVLGTGAAIPGKYRNVSATLLTLSDKSVLLDCGEGTMGQILRSHGQNYKTILRSIQTVFISHLHADHHAGLINFFRQRQKNQIDSPLLIIAPNRYALWLEEYKECSPIGPYSFQSCESLVESTNAPLVTVPVEHCPRSFACVVTLGEHKVVFSGDTRPCRALIEAGLDADLLIHEATMGDDLQEEAIAKRHATISEAITVGREMRAKHVMLNHFSQRYSKSAPPIPKDANNVSVTFDLMQVYLSQLTDIEGYVYNQRLIALLPEDTDIDQD